MIKFTLAVAFLLLVQPKPLPKANELVLNFVEQNLGKKVDRGECWDLANAALTAANAQWTFPTQFGTPINYLNDAILPGDLVQFEEAKFELKTDSLLKRWSKLQHTAIIYKVINKTKVVLAEQNNNNIKKVMLNEIDFGWLKSGKILVYRPQLK